MLSAAERETQLTGSKGGRLAAELAKSRETLQEDAVALQRLIQWARSLTVLQDDLLARSQSLLSLQQDYRQKMTPRSARAATMGTAGADAAAGRKSSFATMTEPAGTPFKIFNDLDPEEPSKTLALQKAMTCEEVIDMALKKFRMTDAADKYVLYEVSGSEERVLSNESPLESKIRLEQQGKKNVKYFLSKKTKEGAMRVCSDDVQGESFKSILVNSEMIVSDIVAMTVKKFRLKDANPDNYDLLFIHGNASRVLEETECPYAIVSKWVRRGEGESIKVVLKRKANLPTTSPTGTISSRGSGERGTRRSAIISAQDVSNLKEIPENDYCADCDAHEPGYVSLNLGLYLCKDCFEIHQQLSGAPVPSGHDGHPTPLFFDSKVRPIQFFVWSEEILKVVKQTGNGVANKFWERTLMTSGVKKPTPTSSKPEKLFYIKEKYVKRRFVQPHLENLDVKLAQCIEKNDIAGAMQAIVLGANINLVSPSTGSAPLHMAATQGNSVMLELLLYAAANPCVEDRQRNTPLHYADIHHPEYVSDIQEYQVIYHAACRNVVPPIGSDNELGKLPKNKFQKFMDDVLLERDRRVRNSSEIPTDPNAQKLAALNQAGFLKFATNIYDQQHVREITSQYQRLYPSLGDGSTDWLSPLQAKQRSEVRLNKDELRVYHLEISTGSLREDHPADLPSPNILAPKPKLGASAAPAASAASTTAGGSPPPSSPVLPRTGTLEAKKSMDGLTPEQRRQQEVLKMELQKKQEGESRTIKEQKRLEMMRKQQEEALAVGSAQRVEKEKWKSDRDKMVKELAAEEAQRNSMELSQLGDSLLKELESLTVTEQEEIRRKEEADRELQERLRVQREQQAEEQRVRAEQDRIRAEELRIQREKQTEEERIRREKEARERLQREAEEERLAAEELRRMELEQKALEEQMRIEEQKAKALREQENKAHLQSSLQDIMQAAQSVGVVRKKSDNEKEELFQKQRQACWARYEPRMNEIYQNVVAGTKHLIEVSKGSSAAELFDATATLVTATHGFVQLSEEMAADSFYDDFRKPELAHCSEQLMQGIKSLAEVTKVAVHNFPSDEAATSIRSAALEMLKATKEFVTTAPMTFK